MSTLPPRASRSARTPARWLATPAAALAPLFVVLSLLLALVAGSPPAHAQTCDPSAAACGGQGQGPASPSTSAPAPPPSSTTPPAAPSPAGARTLTMFWGVGCPHCEEARPFVEALARTEPGLTLELVEVRQDPAGMARFQATMARLGVAGAGIPAFVVGERVVVGFRAGITEDEIRTIVRVSQAPPESPRFRLPLFGELDPKTVSLPALTVAVGLVDGINPCAFYVLVVLLGILLHVRSRARVALYGGIFVLTSGLVYFAFMSAWLGVFTLAGLSAWVTRGLGLALVGMGLVNLKELVWFKQGVSLMIPDKAKPGLFRRMRQVASSASLPAAVLGITTLALLVNLVELGCTLGLPAMYTRVLSLRTDLSAGARTAYLALYNVAYVVPLALIVGTSVVTLHKIAMTERRAKVLKGVSGALLVLFGLVFLVWPGLLR